MVCYDGSSPGEDTCQGDSGSSVICSFGNDEVTMGVSSFGNDCGQGGVYARIDYEWVLAKISK